VGVLGLGLGLINMHEHVSGVYVKNTSPDFIDCRWGEGGESTGTGAVGDWCHGLECSLLAGMENAL